ncbi:hypothetical protein [Ruegeria conchae]|uniref:Uncharacterized protein n=1 Tax=Ruegeria conchae TaxID=981384 RepID=A0A497YXS6_9RHOB|nr:hypothetical protein [Ruegeria conchae]RLJ99867.1 hypothetical protein CLV75_3790 [Ruegeria conchae]
MTKTIQVSDITVAFEAHTIDNTKFGHAQHVQVAFDLLRKYDFIDAAAIYAKGIRTLATNAGAPGKFNLTITYAFMSLIAERMAQGPNHSFEAFIADYPELMSKNALERLYADDRLNSDLARGIFLLPTAA